MDSFPLTFEIPAYSEPIERIRRFSLSASGLEPTSHPVDSRFDRIVGLRVEVPKEMEPIYGALSALVDVNAWCIRSLKFPPYSGIYQSACYRQKTDGTEEVWDSIEALYQRGVGVCEDLACARVAERLFAGSPCRPFLIPQVVHDGTLFHVVVQNPDGSIEDPSAPLGMNLGKSNDVTTPRCRIFLRGRAPK